MIDPIPHASPAGPRRSATSSSILAVVATALVVGGLCALGCSAHLTDARVACASENLRTVELPGEETLVACWTSESRLASVR